MKVLISSSKEKGKIPTSSNDGIILLEFVFLPRLISW